ncbi:hypothetical protein DMC47_08550 [Nostoc sp. 3335mG]|nr:hypothetical protein DMC47_08550 [Nostoc sp. 3335mG]
MNWVSWLRFGLFCLFFDVLFISAPLTILALVHDPKVGLFTLAMGLIVGLPIAMQPTLATIVVAAVFAHWRGYFTFGQFFTIGVAVSAGFGWREVASEDHIWLGYAMILAPLLPFGWVLGWVVARGVGILPRPLPAVPVTRQRQPGAWAATLVSTLSVAVAAVAVIGLASSIARGFTDRESRARGNCPEGLVCTTGPVEPSQPDPRLYVASVAGMRLIVPANSIHMGLSNDPQTPGEVRDLRLKGVLPDFAPRSASNVAEFTHPAANVALAHARPTCRPDGACLGPAELAENSLRAFGKEPLTPTGAGGGDAVPPGLTHEGDFPSTVGGRSSAVFRSEAKGDWIICDKDGSVPVPHCQHILEWKSLTIDMRYQAKWLERWAEARAGLISQLDDFARPGPLPGGIIHIVDPLPRNGQQALP